MHIQNFDPYEFSSRDVEGVPVYYKNLPWSPCVHIRFVFNTGAFDDPIGKEGLSHFFEHIIFDGSPTLPDKKAVMEWEKINALNTWNAWTSMHNTNYYLKCLPEKYETVLAGMKDMIFHPLLKAEDVEHERKIITQEAWGSFMNEKFLAYLRETTENIFHGHVHARFATPLGWPETIAKISREDILLWHKTYYGRGNFFMIVVGNVDEKCIDMLAHVLKDIPQVTKDARIIGMIGKPKEIRMMKTADEIGEIKEQVEISFVRVGEKLGQEKNEIKNLFNKVLYDLLHERLRVEHSLCYNVNLGAYIEQTYSQVVMSVKTDEINIKLVEREFRKVLNEIVDGSHKGRFDLAKTLYMEQVRSTERTSSDVADVALRDITKNNGQIVTLANVLREIEKVTYDDVAQFTAWAFDPEYVHTEIILPSKK